MRERKEVGSKTFSRIGIPSTDENVDNSSGHPLRGGWCNSERLDVFFGFLSGVWVPLFVVAVSVGATLWQFNMANHRADQFRFIDGALATAQETSVLLDEGYNELEKLLAATDSKGWQAFSEESFRDYRESHRLWRQRAVSQHFKLARYFGRDLADQLIRIDEIDLYPIENRKSSEPCAYQGDDDSYNIEEMTSQTRCVIMILPILQDLIDGSRVAPSENGLFGLLNEKRKQEDFVRELLKNYDRTRVNYLRELDKRLTKLGQPRVTVVARSSGVRLDGN